MSYDKHILGMESLILVIPILAQIASSSPLITHRNMPAVSDPLVALVTEVSRSRIECFSRCLVDASCQVVSYNSGSRNCERLDPCSVQVSASSSATRPIMLRPGELVLVIDP